MTDYRPVIIAKRLAEATGYLELGLPQQALDLLAGCREEGELTGPVHYLRGVALRMLSRHGEAIAPLAVAAARISGPMNQHIRQLLAECHARVGQGKHVLTVGQGQNVFTLVLPASVTKLEITLLPHLPDGGEAAGDAGR